MQIVDFVSHSVCRSLADCAAIEALRAKLAAMEVSGQLRRLQLGLPERRPPWLVELPEEPGGFNEARLADKAL